MAQAATGRLSFFVPFQRDCSEGVPSGKESSPEIYFRASMG